MVKNVKIDDKTHREVSIKAAELQALKSDLCSCLIRAAIAKFTAEEIKTLLLQYEPEDLDPKP